jgi:hypothetical protein
MDEWGQERRVAPRFGVRLEASVLIMATRLDDAGDEQFFSLQGQTRDVSESGLAVIISDEDMKEFEQFMADGTMRLLLPLPSGALELEAAPVRHQRLGEDMGGGYLIGARITDMSAHDRVGLMEFIHDIAAGTQNYLGSDPGREAEAV